jgi:hypothetical protein
MITAAILIIMLLWIVSIFSFAKWRYKAAFTPEKPGDITADLPFQIYLKLSGVAVLIWIGLMLTSH